jgi:acyl-CoA synthetase (AMP-forming)/AMP-acid ligase II
MNIAHLAVEGLERFGEYPSISFQDSWYTNKAILQRSAALATVLKERGIRPGDRVVVMMETNIELACAFQAIPRLGAIMIPIMPQWVPRAGRNITSHWKRTRVQRRPNPRTSLNAGDEIQGAKICRLSRRVAKKFQWQNTEADIA